MQTWKHIKFMDQIPKIQSEDGKTFIVLTVVGWNEDDFSDIEELASLRCWLTEEGEKPHIYSMVRYDHLVADKSFMKRLKEAQEFFDSELDRLYEEGKI